MQLARNLDELNALLADSRKRRRWIGFVPTMGALHAGHLSLVHQAQAENDLVVMSIFVNPIQFRPGEDFSAYPRPFEQDRAAAEAAGVHILFAPEVSTMYPEGFSTYVEETRFQDVLCGAFRPGHFRGVCTVVLKLLGMVQPSRMYLGRKDAQQLRILEKMVSDLSVPVEIIGCPTVREPDGLAMSSRNTYLSPDEREVAPMIYRALQKAEAAFSNGEKRSHELTGIVRSVLEGTPQFKVQYVELRRWSDFGEVSEVTETSLLAVALHLGKTRLIDNVWLTP